MTAPKRGLVFNPGNHAYHLDGLRVPGVTTILNVVNKPAIPRWAATEVAAYVADNRETVENLYAMGRDPMVAALKGVPWQRRDAAGKRGNVLHDYAEEMLHGREVDVAQEDVPVMESALAFMDDWGIDPVLIEQAVASREHKWAGTLDLVADHNRGPRAIFDWKSGKRIYAEAVFQLNAYAHADFYGLGGDEHSMADLEIGAAYGVHIREDGYDVYPMKFGPDVYQEFLTIRHTFGINKRADGNWKVPGSGYLGAPLLKEEVS